MAITNVVLKELGGKEELTGGKRIRTYTATYAVKSSIKNENPITILADSRLPALTATWPGDSVAFCVSRDPKQNQNAPDEWTVTLNYTSAPSIGQSPEDNKNNIENPLLRPAIVERSPSSRQRILERDATDALIVNTAGERFNPPLEVEEHLPAFTIKKNVIVWPWLIEVAYTDSINLYDLVYPYRGIVYPAKSVKFNGFKGNEKFEGGFYYWELTGDFEIDWRGWNKSVVSAGYNEKYTDEFLDTYLWPIIGANGERPAEPVLLNSLGRADPYGTPVLQDYKKYREVDQATLFALFGL